MSSTIDLAFGIFIGYLLGVLKEKLRWIEKYVSRKRGEHEYEDSNGEDE